ncbi:MAG: hypothetical protein EP326_08625 [Deltaproteobacteria bacterium]|nr:MAG: hypothetical protein EP326_08625 [Deltaproteobacteria bacterium]
MEVSENIRWITAGIFWSLSFAVLVFNIRRQKLNQDYKDQGINKTISGTPFVFTIFCFLGVAASPLNFNFFWWLIIVFEIPALINFVTEPQEEKSEDRS